MTNRDVTRPIILIDSRERAPLRFSDAVETETVTLPVGDYSLAGYTDTIALERKRLGELATCCGTDRERFIDQIERLRSYPIRALIVEADMDGILGNAYRSEIHPLSVLGTLIKFAVDWQVPIWLAGDARNAALLVERMMLRHARHAARAA